MRYPYAMTSFRSTFSLLFDLTPFFLLNFCALLEDLLSLRTDQLIAFTKPLIEF